MAQRVAEHPERSLFRELGGPDARAWSYEEVARRLRLLAATFVATAGQEPRVAILAGNSLEGACCDLACLTYGILVTPLSPHLNPEALGWILRTLDINVVVTETEEQRANLEAALAHVEQTPEILLLNPEARLRRDDESHLGEAVSRLGAGGGGPAPRRPPPPRPPRPGDGDVHLRQHRDAEGRLLHAVQPDHQALRPGRGAARGGRRRGPALLPAALPHLRALPRDDGHALLGRHLRLRRKPVARVAPGRPAGDAARPASSASPTAGSRSASGPWPRWPRATRRPRGRRPSGRSWATACAGASRRPGVSSRRRSASSTATGSRSTAGSG